MKMFAGLMPIIASPRRAALDRRRFLDESVNLRQRVRYLGAMIGLPLGYDQIDEPLTARRLADTISSPHDPRSAPALQVVREGWTLRDVIAHEFFLLARPQPETDRFSFCPDRVNLAV
ncbi:hypothetical protein [Streptomyces sp. ISL-100]|uniref:hypothetical protein n=1 Tax=Streptomyces sp. ISL-100 TaxID=2819173 RepID=UPI001BE8BF15|nr:hypothetical protein [Streptomyces sp. ISL-100]MBT2395040.1 hypothetical protein [Streptomyces sp. ISL-100]